MSEVNEEGIEEAEGVMPVSGSTLIDQLRQQRKALSADRHLDLDIPGYGDPSKLVGRYKVVDYEEIKQIGKKLEKSKNPNKELFSQIDTLVAALDQIMFRKPDGTLVPLCEEVDEFDNDTPIGFDPNLALLLEIPSESARQTVMGLFGNNALAVISHANDVSEWVQSNRVEDETDF
jgi:hypothetical protein